MPKNKYQYNQETCRYEPVFATGRSIFRRTSLFLFISVVLALAAFGYYNQNFKSLEELHLNQKNRSLKSSWSILQHRIENANRELASLIEKDDNNYRIILDSEALPESVRKAGIGGSEKLNIEGIKEFSTILNNYIKLGKVKNQLEVEVQSYEELDRMLNKKMNMWAARPAIQPINNKQLQHLHMTYGSRFHPLFHIIKEHKGLDFSAPYGTPIYATGDGVISMAYTSDSYGNVIYLDHGHQYETRYAHVSRFAVTAGAHVKRGQVIAYVGSTGHSGGPHLHYEVLFNGQHVNPINFFQRDLSNKEYDKLIKEGSKLVEPLD